jgi:exodeoxyribonuclease V gamma subunit
MLNVYHSNRMERLVERLCTLLEVPLTSPLVSERFVVPNKGLARWLTLQLAARFGIAANYEVFMLASFVWRLFQIGLPNVPETNAFAQDVLVWRVFKSLPELLSEPAFEPLRDYLADDQSGLKHYQLALRTADVFDQYSVYRPDWILDWAGRQEEHWQAQLWRVLVSEDNRPHRVTLYQEFMQRDLSSAVLPERVFVFGLSALAPMYLDILERLGTYTDVHLFVLNPSGAYWGDIISEKRQARLRDIWRGRGVQDMSEYYEACNPLLASWGHLGQDFQQRLYARDNFIDHDEFIRPEQVSLLTCVQHDIFMLADRTHDLEKARISPVDRSVQVHVCHSPLREMEVLHDQLLELFERHPDLQPREVLVMAPHIDHYAPYIQAVFGSAPQERRIPWLIADQPLRREGSLAGFVLTLLELPASRFTASEVVGWLEIPEVQRRFRIRPEALRLIRRWVSASGIRWGHDAQAKAALQQPAIGTHTWRFGFDRLFLGYALPDGTERYVQVAPLEGIEGSESVVLGSLKAFYNQLRLYSTRLAGRYSPEGWHALLNNALDDFLDAADDEPGVMIARAAIDQLLETTQEADATQRFGREVVKAFLEGQLEVGGALHRFASGKVTFCAMVPARAVPFRIVALLGLNDKDYPRRRTPLSFDLMATDPRPGDRSVREEDRYLFLEALLSARDYFILTYVGADARDNSMQQPSVVVSELLDYVHAGFELAQSPVIYHPLQPFSPRYARGERGLFTYATEWNSIPTATQATVPVFCAHRLSAPEEDYKTVSLYQFESFFNHPARHFLRQRFHIGFADEETEMVDEEPFSLGFLELFSRRQTMLDELIRGRTFDELIELQKLRGELPLGHFADLALAEEQEALKAMGTAVAKYQRAVLEPLEVDLRLGDFRLQGWLRGVVAQALLTYRMTKMNGKDVIRLWIRHLLLNAVAQEGYPTESVHLAADGEQQLHGFQAPHRAQQHLENLLEIYWAGLTRPVPFFPRTSYAFYEVFAKQADEVASLRSARNVWESDAYGKRIGEGEDIDYQVAFRGVEALSEEFVDLAKQVFAPVFAQRPEASSGD